MPPPVFLNSVFEPETVMYWASVAVRPTGTSMLFAAAPLTLNRIDPPLPDLPVTRRSLVASSVVIVPPVQAIRRWEPADEIPVPDEIPLTANVPPESV